MEKSSFQCIQTPSVTTLWLALRFQLEPDVQSILLQVLCSQRAMLDFLLQNLMFSVFDLAEPRIFGDGVVVPSELLLLLFKTVYKLLWTTSAV
jgi:hypothetical protein